MGWFDGFPFKTKEQTKKEQEAFEQRVFPFGRAQRDAAVELLAQLPLGRIRPEERLFCFISAKDKYAQSEDPLKADEAARKALTVHRWVKPGDVELFMAMVRLESAATSLEDYPTARQVMDAGGA